MLDLRNCDVVDLIGTLPPESVALVHADPPWSYRNDTIRGGAWLQYDTLPLATIRAHLEASYEVARPDSYLVLWCTFPILMEWAAEGLHLKGWEYITGGCWGKLGNIGVGIHLRGNAELVLLYRKGNPRPYGTTANLWLDRRGEHSEKPQNALLALIDATSPQGGVVLDLYAGASASCARACRALGRPYVGAEIDPARHGEALRRLNLEEQAAMPLELVG